ncbi:MAG: hypothetical protein M1355_01425 [Patescibacteria group bacterium]|nr:hypothetical protein [Patescibacteria group bacterium]
MKIIKYDDYWSEVEACMAERTAVGYKMAVIETDKILRFVLKQKGYPGKDLRQQILLAGWRLEDKKGLEKALEKRDEIVNNLEYRLSTFEAEDAVKAYREAILHFTSKKTLKIKARIVMYYNHYLSIRSTFLQRSLVLIFVFFLLVKFLSSTEVGKSVSFYVVKASDFIFSWFLVFALLGIALLVIVISSFLYFEKSKTRIKEDNLD